MNEKCHIPNPTLGKIVCDFSYKTAFVVVIVNSIDRQFRINIYTTVQDVVRVLKVNLFHLFIAGHSINRKYLIYDNTNEIR